ncbi:MAG: DUF2892 domain-containing protein [Nannocystaceae bacterium]|nr:DUF2892 domain-containing protein [Nannocystaceae bacterium]
MAASAFLARNEHSVERAIRIAVGAGAIGLALFGPQTPWGWFGVIPLATGLLGTCPLYSLFGVSTCKVR